MKKFVVLSLIVPAVLGLSACGGSTTNNSTDVVLNTDDANLSTGMDAGNMSTDNVVDVNASNSAM